MKLGLYMHAPLQQTSDVDPQQLDNQTGCDVGVTNLYQCHGFLGVDPESWVPLNDPTELEITQKFP